VTTVSNTALERCRTVIALGALGAATALIAACGGTTSSGTTSIPTLPGGSAATPGGASGPTSGKLGVTLVMEDGGDDIAHVTMLKVFDPAPGTTDDSTPEGTRWVGVEGTIVVSGSRSGEDSTDVEAIGSDGQTYGADTALALPGFDGCTPTPNDAAQLPSGTTETFCSGVPLPMGVTVSKIGYSTEGVQHNGIPAKLFWTVAASSASTPTDTPAATDTPSATATPGTTPGASTSATTGHVGDTLTISGATTDTVHITLVQVFDPATGVPAGETPPDGTHWVGFDMTIAVDDGSASFESDAVDVVGSDGQTYGLGTAYHLTAMAGCTPTTGGSGQTTTFCAGVGLPTGVTVAQVGYSEAGVDIGAAAQVTWTVP
jgi:hypothetical protein